VSTDLGPDRPFPGLRPYEARDHHWFFGREDQCLSLYRLLDRGRLVAVVGSSGSGKSSMVKAGLLPVLEGETTGGRPRWRCWEMRPGDTPLGRLADTLAGHCASGGDESAAFVQGGRRQRLGFLLRSSSFGLLDTLGEVGLADGTTPLLLVDQFEELFRFADLPGTEVERSVRRQEAAAFVQLLLEATRAASSRLRVVLTLRSDYLGDCSRFHGLPEAVTASQFLVPSLTRDQREQVIRRPIEKAEGTITDELVERLLSDSTEELDQLPVLQHALMRTWNESRGRLRGEDYERVGGVAAAISLHADSLLEEAGLRPLGLAVEQVFRALAELDRYGRAIRRPLPFRQLVEEAGVEEASVRMVADRFRSDDCAFLVPPLVEGQPLVDADIVDIAHEALIRRWSRMTQEVNGLRTGWLGDEVADGRTYVALAETARGSAPGNPALLPLDQVEERRSWWARRPRTAAWSDRYGGRLETVQKLLADSAHALEVRRLMNEEEAAREAAAARRHRLEGEARIARREVLTRTQAMAFVGVSLMAMAMNLGFVYRTPPFSWPVLLMVCAVTIGIYWFSPGAVASGRFRLSLDQTVVAYYTIDLAALAYLIHRSGGLSFSAFTVFLLLLPMNAVLLEESVTRVRRYFAVVLLVAIGLAAWPPKVEALPQDPKPREMLAAQILVLIIAFGTALSGYRPQDRQRRDG
jgi:conflict system STAND superfamily ATPase